MTDWHDDLLEAAMAEAGMVQAPPIDPPMPPHRPGDRPTHRGDHVYTRIGDSNTQPFTHVWGCTVVGVKSGTPCTDTITKMCTQYTDRYTSCRCFDGRE